MWEEALRLVNNLIESAGGPEMEELTALRDLVLAQHRYVQELNTILLVVGRTVAVLCVIEFIRGILWTVRRLRRAGKPTA